MSSLSSLVCPGCGVNIPNAELVGIEIRGIYDGVLIWRHEGTCGHMWPRFTAGRLHEAAVEHLARTRAVKVEAEAKRTGRPGRAS